MRLARLVHATPDGPEPRIAVAARQTPDRWIDVRQAEIVRWQRRGASTSGAAQLASLVASGSLTTALQTGEAFLEAAALAVADNTLDPVDSALPLTAPVDPPCFRDFMAFEGHFLKVAELRDVPVADVLYELPVSYLGNPAAIVGPKDDIPWPAYAEHMDYELELGIVIERGGRDITPADALDHVLGLTIVNDFSARDIQTREMTSGLGPSKGKHFATAVGPMIVTLDELGDLDLGMRAAVNGETWSAGTSGSMLWSIAELVAWASTAEPLAHGTLLASGTMAGGCGAELGRRLSPSDTVELEVETLGTLRNQLGQPAADGWMPEPRERKAAKA